MRIRLKNLVFVMVAVSFLGCKDRIAGAKTSAYKSHSQLSPGVLNGHIISQTIDVTELSGVQTFQVKGKVENLQIVGSSSAILILDTSGGVGTLNLSSGNTCL